MTEDKIAHMANQIATFFSAKPPEVAARGVAEHVNAFWDPRMRAKLIALLAAGGAGLAESVRQAGPAIRPPPAG